SVDDQGDLSTRRPGRDALDECSEVLAAIENLQTRRATEMQVRHDVDFIEGSHGHPELAVEVHIMQLYSALSKCLVPRSGTSTFHGAVHATTRGLLAGRRTTCASLMQPDCGGQSRLRSSPI